MNRKVLQIGACVILLLTTEQLVPVIYKSFPVEWKEWDRVEKKKELIAEPTNYDTLILGDSTGIQGIIPDVYEHVTGKKTLNLTTYADRNAIGDIYLLRDYLDHHPAPTTIVLVRSVLSWYIGYGYEIVRLQFNNTDVALRATKSGVMSVPQFGRLLFEKVFPSFMYREKVAFTRGALLNKQAQYENMLKYMEGKGLKGYEPFNPQMHHPNLELSERNLDPFYKLTLSGGGLNLATYSMPLLHELCTLAEENNIQLYLAFNPLSHVVETDQRIGRSIEKLFTRVQQELAPTHNCRVLPKLWVMDDQYLSDLTHTNDAGAHVYTKYVAEEVMKLEKE